MQLETNCCMKKCIMLLLLKKVQGFGFKDLSCPVIRQDLSSRAHPSSSENGAVQSQTQIHGKTFELTRRDSVSKVFSNLLFGSTVLTFQLQPSEAACLSGDTSTECIGYYKVPIDDEVTKYVDTPENLLKFAPDLKWVPPVQYPKTYKLAREELVGLQTRVQNLRSPVLKGDLIDVGTEILDIVPRITVAGRVVIRNLNSYSDGMIAQRSEVAHSDLLINLGDIDVTIGQFIKEQNGALTVTQIEILSVLKEADANFSELMKTIPASSKGGTIGESLIPRKPKAFSGRIVRGG